ncbi:MAG: hydantoinase B/oxoprolinase family protein [Candidatus Methylomirabilia bacterium]
MPRDSRGRDPITVELIKNALESIADEMAVTVVRTARSFVLKEAMDFSTALFTSQGEMIAQGTCLPLHLGSMPEALKAVLRYYEGAMAPGDIYVLNDPYDGGSHLPDIIAVKPIFAGERLAGYSAVLGHQTDIGGRVAGGNACDSTEIYQEGLRIPPLKVYDRGRPQEEIFRLIERNVRVPEKVLGDVRALLAACAIGEREYLKLVGRYGLAELEGYCTELLDYTEQFTRAEIAALPDGECAFTDYIDDDGIDPTPVRFQVRVTVEGTSLTCDFTGTSPQVKGAINSVLAFTSSTVFACVRAILDRTIPNNAAFFRPIRIVAPERTIVNPRPPAAVAARGLTAMRIADTVFGALAQLAPDKVPACGVGVDSGISLGGYYPDGSPFVFLEFLVGSWGGGPWRDGMDACTGIPINYSNTPAELVEAEQPIRVERYGFVPDSGGAGLYRGGLALVRDLRFLAPEATLQVRSDRRKFRPYGLKDGKPGAASLNVLNPDGEQQVLPSKFLFTIKHGDLFRLVLAGGGGYGNPLERDPMLVLGDLIEEKLTRAHAREEYGVVVRGSHPEVDWEETKRLRAELGRQAGGT